jgi:hypothetical protein
MDARAVRAETERLENELERDLELIREAHEAKRRALRVLMTMEGQDPDQMTLSPPAETNGGRERAAADGATMTDRVKASIIAALPTLADRITRPSLDAVIGEGVSRGTQLRALKQLVDAEVLAVVEKPAGRRPAVYKRGPNAS